MARYYRTTGFEEIPEEVTQRIQNLASYCDDEFHQDQGQAILNSRVGTIVFGKVTDNPRKNHERLKPLLDYVVNRMKDLGITQGDILFAKNNQEMISYLKQGKIDWVSETFFSGIIFCQKGGAEILARRWKGGAAEYHSIIFARKGSAIESFDDLKGKKIAFEDPGSTASYFVPMSEFIKSGFEMHELKGPRSDPPNEKVGYAFSGSDLNTTTWVHKGLTDAGAFSSLNWVDPDDCPEIFRKDLKIIHRTKHFPRALEIIRKDIDPEIKKRLKMILLSAKNDPRAKDALRAYDKTAGFDEFSIETLKTLKETLNLLENTD